MRKLTLLSVMVFGCIKSLMAQVPSGYYSAANGIAGGNTLLVALKGIIDNHNPVTYADLELEYPKTDKKSNGKVWDMYSYKFVGAQPYEFNFVVDQCGNYSAEGDCFNKEHLWPQSLFGQAMPMRSDLHHVPPTDGWVNNKRSNFPFGEISTTTWTSLNGSKLGYGSTYSGYSGLLFEPIDSFKGDIARSIMYVSCRYNGEANSWSSWEMATKNALIPDAITLLLKWHNLDPVSPKEIARNNAIYLIQNNRNPFIDEPKYAECIWGNASCNGTIPISIEENKIPKIDFVIENNSLKIINANKAVSQISFFNCVGQFISLPSFNNQVDINSLPTGVYTAAIIVDGVVVRKKFFKG